MRMLPLVCPLSLSLSLAWRDPGFCINCPDRVLVCHYSNTLAISCALSPSLESVPSLFLCCNRKMRPPPRVQLDFEFSLLLLLAGDVSLNPGPGVPGLRLGTVNARSMRDKAPALSDLVASKSIDLLGITETWLTTKETSADLADMTPEGFSFFHKPRTRRRGRGVGLFVSSAHKFTAISLPTQTSVEAISGKLECGQPCLIILKYLSPTWSCYCFFQWATIYSVLHIYTPSRSGSDGGLQSSYWFLIIWRWTAIWYFGLFRPLPIRWLSYPHSRSFSRSNDLLSGMQRLLCFGLWFDFGPLFCCC